AFGLFLVNAVWIGLSAGGVALVVFLVLSGFFCEWYAVLRRGCRSPLLRAHVVLLKYPAIVYLLAAPAGLSPQPRFAVTLALVYLTFCVYEGLHDDRLRTARASAVLAVETVALAAVALLTAPGRAAVLAAGLGAVLLALLYLRYRSGALPAPWPYAVFVVA